MRAFAIASLLLIALRVAQAVEAPESYWKKYHRAMKEPPLASEKTVDGDFQFRWTRLSGSGEPLSIRVWQANGHSFARSVRLEYRYDYSGGHITRDQTISVPEKQAKQLRSYFEEPAFWQPFNKVEAGFEDSFLGGAHWLFEIKDSSGYHFISMFSPPLFLHDLRPPKLPKGMRGWDAYISAATFLLRTTNIFPDEHEASY